MKLAVVGGGSTYTPELVDGMARLRDVLPLEELVLIDPDANRLELVGGFSRRIMAAHDHPAKVSWTSDLDAGIDSANAVVLQLRVGGQAARNRDESWPLECGCIGQETTGAGGLAKALRTVPVVLDIAERARKLAAPGAWVVDFTNPVGIVTRALLDAGNRCVGLCNVAIGFQRRFAAALGVEPNRVRLDHVGLNHLSWERAVYVDDVDALPRLLADHGDDLARDLGLPVELLRELGVVPSYYLRYYYEHDTTVEEHRGQPTRAQVVAELETELLRMYADPALAAKPGLLERRGGAFYSEAAVQLVASLHSDTNDVQVVNVRNAGTLPFLSDDAVIEVPAVVGAAGATPLPVAPVEPLFAGLIAHTTAYEELAVEAAVKGGRDRVFKALLAHPLVGQVDLANQLTDRLLAENARYPAVGRRDDEGVSTHPNPPVAVLAIDGGNSKTDVALVAADGSLLARTRGPGVPAPTVGLATSVDAMHSLIAKAASDAGLPFEAGAPLARHTAAYLAGVDIPAEQAAMDAALCARRWSLTTSVDNDTFAILRAGSTAHWGVGIVAGAGINAVGIGPDGRVVRFLAIGEITGDDGGGGDLSRRVMWHAIRDEDGRGAPTLLRRAVIEYFGLASVEDVAIAMHVGEIGPHEIYRLTHVLFAVAAKGDPIAVSLVDRQAREVALLAKSTMRRLDLSETTTDVVLGGGVLTSGDPLLYERIAHWMEAEAPRAVVRVNDVPAIAGAALLGLDHLGIGPDAEARLRESLRVG